MSAALDIEILDENRIIERLHPTREAILRLQDELAKFDQLDLPLKHTFAPGQYAREILLPKGCIVVGKIHKHAHLNIVTRGHVTVVTEFGLREIDARSAPVTFTSDAGSKRALYCHEETIWTTIHSVNTTDLAEIEREIIAPTYAELDQFMARELATLIEGAEDTSAGRVSLRPGSSLP
jgi:hypothetical protein